MRFLATGSDDQAVHVFDLRTATLLHRLQPPSTWTNVVTDVAFHPSRPQLVAACMNGHLWFYEDC
jgi:WD40 repeat protein